MWWKLWVALALYGAVLPLNQGSKWSKCKVKPVRCFDKDTEGNDDDTCTFIDDLKNQDVEDEEGSEYEGEIDDYFEAYNDTYDSHFCQVHPDKRTTDRTSWLPCDRTCFDEHLKPLNLSDPVKSIFCYTKATECISKFTHNGKTYEDTCTFDSIGVSDKKEAFLWCATEVNENNEMVNWGVCDLSTCQSISIECDPSTSKCAEVTLIDSNGVSGNVTFKQSSESEPLKIFGKISGLKPGKHGFHAHEKGAVDCQASGGHFNPSNVKHGSRESETRHDGDFGNIEAGEDGVAHIGMLIPSGSSLFNANSLIGKTLVIHADEDDHGLGGDAGSEATGNAGDRLTCGIISEKTNLIFIIIIVLAVIIVVLLILITVLVIYCCK